MPEQLLHDRRWRVLLVLIASLFTVNLDNTILNVALPTLARDLGASTSQLQWMVDAYILVFAGLLLAAGALGDRFGRRHVLVLGLVVFGTGSIASAFAPSADILIPLRAVMGFGGALITPSTLSITRSAFSAAERPKAIAIWTSTAGLGIVLGPVLAGLLLDRFAWGSIFLINVPIVLASLAGVVIVIPESSAADAPPLDVPGAILSVGALAALVYATIEAPTNGWLSPVTVGAYLAAAGLAGLFVVRELRAADPMLDVRIFARPALGGAVIAVLLSSLGMMGSMFFLAQYLQSVVGFTTLETGFSIIPLAVALGVASPISALFSRRIGARTTVAGGLGLVAAGLIAMARIDSGSGYVPVALTLVLVGTGMALAGTPVTTLMIQAVPASRAGVASAINSTARELGSALGVAILGSIAAPIYATRLQPIAGLLPPIASSAATGSVTGAVTVAAHLPAAAGASLEAAARAAFVDGMTSAVLVGAVVAIAGALLAYALLPGRTVTSATRIHAVSISECDGRPLETGPAAA